MHTIALVSQKGGSGKSTLAIGLALAAMNDGHKVCLLETDPQGTLSNWRQRRTQTEPAVEAVTPAELEDKIPFLDRCGVTLVIVDTPAGHGEAAETAIRCADLCLIPARPTPIDIEATAPTLACIRAIDKPFGFVLNQTPVRSYRNANAASTLAEAAALSNVLAPSVALRNDQQDALGAGLSVTEYALAGKSAEEILGLWQWVWGKLIAAEPNYELTLPANEQSSLRAVG